MEVVFLVAPVYTPAPIQQTQCRKKISVEILDFKTNTQGWRHQEKNTDTQNNHTHPEIQNGSHQDIPLCPPVGILVLHTTEIILERAIYRIRRKKVKVGGIHNYLVFFMLAQFLRAF